jgi:hypothetical protein
MLIRFEEKGGVAFFPGLSRPVTIDTDKLDQHDVEHLKELIAASRFFDLPSDVGSPAPGAADYKLYSIKIEDGGESNTVHVVEPIENPELAQLVQFVRAKARAVRQAQARSQDNN